MKKIQWQNSDEIKNVIAKNSNITHVLNSLGLKNFRNNRLKLKEYIVEHNIDISHFIVTKREMFLPEKKIEEIFVENSKSENNRLKKKILRFNLLEYRCQICGNNGSWNGKKLSLDLDHINGVRNDNRLENLRFLCPNCHAQEPTSNKNTIRKLAQKEEVKRNKIVKPVVYKIDWPDDKELQELLMQYPMSELAKQLGVSDRVIAKRAKKRNLKSAIDIYGRGYWIKKKPL